MQQPHGASATDNIKQMVMSMFMMKSMTPGNDSGPGSGLSVVYGIIVMGILEKMVEHVLPSIIKMFNVYFNSKMATVSNRIREKTKTVVEPTACIQFKANYLSGSNVVSDAILDFATNLPNVKQVIFIKNVYLMNYLEPICIDQQNSIFMKLNKKVELGDDAAQNDSYQLIDLYSNELNIYELRKFVNKVVHEYTLKIQNKLGDKLYYFDAIQSNSFRMGDGTIDYSKQPPHLTFTMKHFITNRRFTNVVGKESKLIQKRVEFFKNNKKWYDSKGIPYTLGLLLSGHPGGGKTSTIKCVANETVRHIINVKLNDSVTKSQLESLFFNENIHVLSNGKTEVFCIPIEKRVYVFEDVDCQSSNIVMDRKLLNSTEDVASFDPGNQTNIKSQPQKPADNPTLETLGSSEKLSLSCLLNIFDGILETPGRIIIMTSNYPKLLDKALIRPGRIDLICEFKRCDSDMIVEFIEKFYDVLLSEVEIEHMNQMTHGRLTPAEVTKIMFENFNDYKNAIETIKHISFETLGN